MKKIELSESGKRKIKEALRKYHEREARVENSLKNYATEGRYDSLIYEEDDPNNAQNYITQELGFFGELVYIRKTNLKKETGEINSEFFMDISNIVSEKKPENFMAINYMMNNIEDIVGNNIKNEKESL